MGPLGRGWKYCEESGDERDEEEGDCADTSLVMSEVMLSSRASTASRCVLLLWRKRRTLLSESRTNCISSLLALCTHKRKRIHYMEIFLPASTVFALTCDDNFELVVVSPEDENSLPSSCAILRSCDATRALSAASVSPTRCSRPWRSAICARIDSTCDSCCCCSTLRFA